MSHADAASNPELWIPDQLLGAMGDTMTRLGNWDKWQDEWKTVEKRIQVVDTPLA